MSAEDVLAAHQWGHVDDDGYGCTCPSDATFDEWPAHMLEELAAAGYAVVELPTVAHKGPHDTDAKFFRQVADRMERATVRVDYLSGNNVRNAVRQLLYRAADAAEQVIA